MHFRLRKCSKKTTYRPELLGECSVVRELHVYGSVVPVSGRDVKKFQHQGYGGLLMQKAEDVAFKEHKSTKIAVISGVGTRNYYRKLGYVLEGPYMVKSLIEQEYKSVLSCIDGEKVQVAPKKVERKRWTLSDKEWLEKFDMERGNNYCEKVC